MDPHSPLHTQLYEVMRERIQSGVWNKGERVPSEKALIEEFGTSRGPVRQALAALRAEGLIAGGRGAPPRIQGPVPSQSFDTFMSFTEWAKELGSNPGQRLVEAARRPATEAIADALQVRQGDSVVEVVRLRTLDGKPVMLENAHYIIEVGLPLLAADLETNSIYQIMREHSMEPVRARNVIDAVAAEALDAEWLDVPLGSPLLRLRRTSLDADGRVVELANNRYLPSMATFTVENTSLNRSSLARTAVGASISRETPPS